MYRKYILSDEIFRQYDIRGRVGSELFIEEMYDLTGAIALYWKEKNPKLHSVVVGADARVHSPAIVDEVCRSLQESGLDVVCIGLCPTPLLYFALHTSAVDAGIMITASHNPQEYNGLKVMLGTKAVWGEDIQCIKKYYAQKKRYVSNTVGLYSEKSLIEPYIAWLGEHFQSLKNMKIKAVIDCGNGATGVIVPKLCEYMRWESVKILYPEADGSYPHHAPDPTLQENMNDVRQLLYAEDYDLGIGFDGDGDRMAAMTKSGELLLGDKLLALFADDIRRHVNHATIVYDLKCSAGLQELLHAWGMDSYRTPTGSAWVREAVQKYNASLGGEFSCHLFFNDRYFGYDDGIYAMMRLLEIMVHTKQSLEDLVSVFPHKISSSEIRFEYPQGKQDSIIEHVVAYFKHKNVDILTIDGVYVTFNHGWAIVRISHTQPVLSIRFEGDTDYDFKEIQNELVNALAVFFEQSFLQKMLS